MKFLLRHQVYACCGEYDTEPYKEEPNFGENIKVIKDSYFVNRYWTQRKEKVYKNRKKTIDGVEWSHTETSFKWEKLPDDTSSWHDIVVSDVSENERIHRYKIEKVDWFVELESLDQLIYILDTYDAEYYSDEDHLGNMIRTLLIRKE